jgi:hypothetical protein
VTNLQKAILAGMAVIAAFIFALLLGAVAFMLLQGPETAPVAVAQEAPTPLPETAAPLPETTPTATPTLPVLPTATSTRVVVETVLPTDTPVPVNCIDNIINFETSGLVTNADIEQYLRQTIPASHLDYCRVIEYQPRLVGAHATPVAGSFTPMFRQIYVYAIPQEFHTTENLLDTLVHEVGHNVHYNMRRQDWNLGTRWTELYKRSKESFAHNGLGYVSEYARFNDFEDFAETYWAYVRQPELLKFANLEKYEFMRQEVFGGREY